MVFLLNPNNLFHSILQSPKKALTVFYIEAYTNGENIKKILKPNLIVFEIQIPSIHQWEGVFIFSNY